MITCKKCNALLQDDARFCNNCGAKVNETVACPACGKQVSAEYDFCLFCGTPLKAPAIQEAPVVSDTVYQQTPELSRQEQQTPTLSQQEPTQEQQTPVMSQQAPTLSQQSPEPEQQTPALSEQTAIPELQVPVSNQPANTPSQQPPVPNRIADVQSPVYSPVQPTAPAYQNNPATPVPMNQSSQVTPVPVNLNIPAQNYSTNVPQGKPAKPVKVKKEKPVKQEKLKKEKPVKKEKLTGQQKASDNTEQPVKSKSKKWLILIPALIIVLAAGAFAAFLFLKKDSNINSVIYMKDGELSYISQKSKEPIELTDNFYNGDTNNYFFKYQVSSNINYSKDGKRIFYPDKMTDGSMDLYYLNLKSKDGEGEKIVSKISRYAVNSAGTIVYYIKGDSLYRSNLADEEKIDSNVANFYISEDGKKLVYQDMENNIYYKNGDKDEIKLDSNSEISYASESLDKVYYLKNNSLYLSTGGEDGEKLLSDVTRVLNIYDTGEIYYLNTTETQMLLSDFVNDDLLASDAALVEPMQPVYPYYEDCRPTLPEPVEPNYSDYYDEYYWVDWDAYYADLDVYTQEINNYNAEWDRVYQAALEQYDKDYAAYEDAYEQYNLKASRDEIRNALGQNSITVTQNTLYYYDNEKATAITDKFSDYSSITYLKPGIVYQNLNTTELTKINMSEVTSFDDVNTYAQEAVNSSTEDYVALGSVTSAIKQTDGRNYSFNASNTALYFLDNYDEENGYGDLYEAQITGTSVGAPELYDKEVADFQYFGDSDSVLYYKEKTENATAELYLNKKRVDFDVHMYNVTILDSKDKDSFCYVTDFDPDTETGTLKLYNGTEPVKIADDVYDYYAVDEKYMVYLKDYKSDNSYGDLYQYSGTGKEKRIDKKVSMIIPRYDN
jgi:hypothetical protein